MSRYSDEIRERAIKMMKEIGVIETSKEMKIADQTLYRWRKELGLTDNAATQMPVEQPPEEIESQQDTGHPADSEYRQNIKIPKIEEKLKRELEDMRHLNQIVEETIDYLIIENRQLRERCERYLKALSLLAQ